MQNSAQSAFPDKNSKCHRCNFEKSCRELVLDGACQRWSKISGSNPQTGEPMDKWACIDDLTHILLLEIGNQASKISVEVNALRNEVAKGNDDNVSMGAMAVQRATTAVKDTFTKTLIDFLPERNTKLLESN